MTIDEPRNPHHAAALERGENPEATRRREEDERIEALARLLGEHDREHTTYFYRGIVHRLNAYKRDGRVTSLLAAPAPRIHRDLQQQQSNRYEDADHILERLHELRAEEALLYGYLRSMGSPHADGYDADLAGVRDDDRRAKQDAQSEAAIAEAPSVRSA